MEHYWTALFCTIHLAIGFLAGRFFRESVAIPTAWPGFGPAVARFEHAYWEVQPSLAQLPQSFQQALEGLKQSIRSLAQEVRVAQEEKPATVHSRVATTAPTRELIPAPPTNARKDARHGHAVPEFIALWDGEIASVQAFERVQCHDLSASGISFFREQPLDAGEQLVITLGQQNGGLLMAASVIYSRPIIVRGEDLYRVGCKFVRRLDASEAGMLDPLLSKVRSVYAITCEGLER